MTWPPHQMTWHASKQVTSPPWNSRRLVHSKEMVWASRWSVALRTFYRQILSLLYSSFFFWNFRPRLARELLVYILLYTIKIIPGPGSLSPIIHLFSYSSLVKPHKAYSWKKLTFHSPANPPKFGTQRATLWTRKLNNPQLVRCSLRAAATEKVGMKDGCPPTKSGNSISWISEGAWLNVLRPCHFSFRKLLKQHKHCYIFAKKHM